MNKFWNWAQNSDTDERTLSIYGVIAEESWYDDDVTPKQFRDELNAGSGDVTVRINSPGGDCIAAAQIYTMLRDYPYKVTVKIDALAASAASVIAMAGDDVHISPVAMLMIHNPATIAFGERADMEKAIGLLDATKDSIINAYEAKTGLSRAKISHMMDAETWMDANAAVENGFADAIDGEADQMLQQAVTMQRRTVEQKLVAKLKSNSKQQGGRTARELYGRLDLLKI